MALALFLHIAATVLIGLLVGRLYYASLSKGASSPKLMRWIGLILLVVMTVGFWLRFFVSKGVTPTIFNLSSEGEYSVSLLAFASLVLLALISAGRLIRMALLAKRREARREETIREICRRDIEGEGTLYGKTFADLEAEIEDICRDFAGPGAHLSFQFIEGLPKPLVAGWLSPVIRCPLGMASGEGGRHLELAALREVELLRQRVISWRLALIALLALNPMGALLARGILLTLEFEADQAALELGDGARAHLVDLIEYEERGSGEGRDRNTGLLGSGDKTPALRRAQLQGAEAQGGGLLLLAGNLVVAAWAGWAAAIGPVGFESVYGIVSLKPPGYLAVEEPQEGIVVQAIPGAGLSGHDAAQALASSARDGFLADARTAGPGLATLWFHAPILGVPTLRVRVEVIPGSHPGLALPMLYLSMLDINRAGPVVSDYTVKWCQFEPLTAGAHDLAIPLQCGDSGIDAGIYLPQGWAIRVTNLREGGELALAQGPDETRRKVRAIATYEARWKVQRLSVRDALDWSPANLERQRPK